MISAAGPRAMRLRVRALEPLLVPVVLGGLAVLLLANSLTQPFNHDEQQYVAGAALARDLLIYRDFVHLQTPYFPMLASLAVALDPQQPFLMVRLFNWLAAVISVIAMYAICRAVRAPVLLGLGAATLLASSSVVHFSFGVARNDVLPLAFALVGVYLYLRALSASAPRTSSVLFFVAAVLLAASVGSRVTYAFVPATIVVHSLWMQARNRRPGYLAGEFLPLAAGGFAGAVPMLVVALSNPQGFWYGVVGYHSTAPLAWYAMRGLEDRLVLSDQLEFFMRFFLRTDATLAASIWLATLLICWFTVAKRPETDDDAGTLLLPLFLLLAAIPFAFVPRPSWIQYFVPMVPFLIMAPIFLQRALPDSRSAGTVLAALAVAVVAMGSLPGLGRLALGLPRAIDSGDWTTAEFSATADRIDEILERAGATGPVASLGPIHVLESDHDVYAEFASGVFFFRTSDLLTPEAAAALNGATPASLDQLFAARRPAGVLVGVESDEVVDVEGPLRDWAVRNRYQPVPIDGESGATLYVAPR